VLKHHTHIPVTSNLLLSVTVLQIVFEGHASLIRAVFRDVLQVALRGSLQPLVNFWLIVLAFCCWHVKYRIYRRYTGIEISVLPYIDTSCPSLLRNAEKENKVQLAVTSSLLNWPRALGRFGNYFSLHVVES
jgi:hypothetical protein